MTYQATDRDEGVLQVSDQTAHEAVIYVRVSSTMQVTKGQGAQSQAARCRDFAERRGYTVTRTFEDKAVSGSLINRPGMKDMLAYLKDRKDQRVHVIIDDISRLARGLDAHLKLRTAISDAGGVLESPSIEFGNDSDSQLIEHLLASVAAHGRTKNAEQTRNRMHGRLIQGYYPFTPPWGLKHERREGQGNVLVRDEPLASVIQEALEGFASGVFRTQSEVMRFLNDEPDFPKGSNGKVHQQRVKHMLTRQLYAGMIEYEPWGVSLREGKHEGLISFATFEAIQDRLNGKAYAPARTDLNADFPLRGAVACASCRNNLTACWSTGKVGTKHPYYMCYKKGCADYRKSIRRADIEGAFEDMLKTMTPAKTLIDLTKAMFSDAWNAQAHNAKSMAQTITKKIQAIDTQITGLVDRLMQSSQSAVIKAYENKIDGLERDKLVLAEQLTNKSAPRYSFEETFEHTLSFLSSPWKIWQKGQLEHRQTVLRLVFDRPLQWQRNEGFRTPEISSVYNSMRGFCGEQSQVAERKSV